MLLGQNGGRHQIHHLLSVLQCLKSRPKRDLRLAIAYVTADQTVHDLPALHVFLGGVNGLQLIVSLIIWEQFLKLPLPHGVLAVLETIRILSGGIKLHQVFRNLLDRPLHPGLGFLPLFTA